MNLKLYNSATSKKEDFKSDYIKFNLDQQFKWKPLNYPENKVREIPEFMFSNNYL